MEIHAQAESPQASDMPLCGFRDVSRTRINWSTVIAGAVVSAVSALCLLMVCVGFNLAPVSPWVRATPVTTLAAITVVAAILIQLVASATGSLIAARVFRHAI